ncbi:UNVERIFIED_CONTAM: hypothetical protein HDU68_003783, partial [Siphonaria sp. JEL0065]
MSFTTTTSTPKPIASRPLYINSHAVSTLTGLVQETLSLRVPTDQDDTKSYTQPSNSATTSTASPPPPTTRTPPSILIFSGGSAVSSFVPMLQKITDNVCYVMPFSDDGGSTFEIVKVMGGPGIGDIRSRILGLADQSTLEGQAVYKLLSYRLPCAGGGNSTCPAKMEWMSILEGNHILWTDIPLPHQYTIRSFLFQFHDKLLKETAGLNIISNGEMKQQTFDFRGGCIGNFFITGCRLFFHSLEAAIFQFSKLVGCPNKTNVLPIVATGHYPVAIGVTLRNGACVYGQCEISHPGVTAAPVAREVPPLPSPIRRVFYISPDNHTETIPKVNQLVPQQLSTKRTVIYGMGSLYTSLLPNLVVPGVGEMISNDYRRSDSRSKILLLNGTHDRETEGYTAMDFVLAITDTLNYSVIADRGGEGMVKKVMTKRDASTDMDGADQVWRWRGALVGTGVTASIGSGRRPSDTSSLSEGGLFIVGSVEGSEDGEFEDDDDAEQDISEMQSP